MLPVAMAIMLILAVYLNWPRQGNAADAPAPSPDMLAMQNRILREVSDNLSCNAAAITAQRRIEELETRIKAVEEKK